MKGTCKSRKQVSFATKAVLSCGYTPTLWKRNPSSSGQHWPGTGGKQNIKFTVSWVSCITVMKWESWENKQLIHCKCKTALPYKMKATIKLMGHGLWMHCSGSLKPKVILKTVIQTQLKHRAFDNEFVHFSPAIPTSSTSKIPLSARPTSCIWFHFRRRHSFPNSFSFNSVDVAIST